MTKAIMTESEIRKAYLKEFGKHYDAKERKQPILPLSILEGILKEKEK